MAEDDELSKDIPFRSFIAGGMAGMTVDLVLFPLDVIKTQIQAAHFGRKVNKLPKKWYAGLSSAMLGSFPAAAAFYGSYDLSKTSLKQYGGVHLPNWLIHMLSASIAESFSSAVRVPFEIVKQQMQAGMHTTPSNAVKKIVSIHGISGLWMGMSTTVARDIPFDCIQFSLWEEMKSMSAEDGNGDEIPLWKQAALGSVAGGVAAFLTTPLDVAKTRVMTQSAKNDDYNGIVRSLKTIYSREGWKALFLGVVPRVCWISVGGAIYLGGCASYKHFLNKL